jgi:KaiC/GvpD/RAD55 family RecA-like ATPase
MSEELVSVRYMVNDVQEAIDFNTRNRIHFVVDDIARGVKRVRDAGVSLRYEIVTRSWRPADPAR